MIVILQLSLSFLFTASNGRHHIWLAYLWPTTKNWDYVFSEGDIWKYDERKIQRTAQVQYIMRSLTADFKDVGMKNDRSMDDHLSVLDVSCNLGYMLQAISSGANKRSIDLNLYGLDISKRMVEETHKNCVSCLAEVFDLSTLDDASSWPSYPDHFDYVLVSDVLYYLKFGGIPPLIFKVCEFCRTLGFVVEREKRFADALSRLARKEVVFSNHQGNDFAKSFLTNVGATFLETEGVYILEGKTTTKV